MASQEQCRAIAQGCEKVGLSWDDVRWNAQNNIDIPDKCRIWRKKSLTPRELYNTEVSAVFNYLSLLCGDEEKMDGRG